MSWLFSQALVKKYSAEQPSVQAYWASSNPSDTCPSAPVGTVFQTVPAKQGVALLESFWVGLPVIDPESLTREEIPDDAPIFLTRFDKTLNSWRKSQYSLLGETEEFLEVWPRWGTMRDGTCWEQQTPERFSDEDLSEFSEETLREMTAAKTPWSRNQQVRLTNTTKTSVGGQPSNITVTPKTAWLANYAPESQADSSSCSLFDSVSDAEIAQEQRTRFRLWPTVLATDHGPRRMSKNWIGTDLVCVVTRLEEESGNTQPRVGGRLSHTWVELLMGWPQNWTSLIGPVKFEPWKAGSGVCWGEGWDKGIPRLIEADQHLTKNLSLENDMVHRADRIFACGNGQVPAVVVLAWKTLTAKTKLG